MRIAFPALATVSLMSLAEPISTPAAPVDLLVAGFADPPNSARSH